MVPLVFQKARKSDKGNGLAQAERRPRIRSQALALNLKRACDRALCRKGFTTRSRKSGVRARVFLQAGQTAFVVGSHVLSVCAKITSEEDTGLATRVNEALVRSPFERQHKTASFRHTVPFFFKTSLKTLYNDTYRTQTAPRGWGRFTLRRSRPPLRPRQPFRQTPRGHLL